MKENKRSRIIEEFKNCLDTTALILSITASAIGLNLTMANHVFIVDPWWNVFKICINKLACNRRISNWKSSQNWINPISVY